MERWKINLYTIWVSQIFSLMGFGFAIPFIPYYLQHLGVTVGSELNFYIGLASTLPAATMAVAAPIWGMVSDRYGRKMMLLRAMIAASILLIIMGSIHSVFLFMILRGLQGIFTGTITASMAFVSANTPENKMSYALGFMTSSNFLGYSIGPFVGGFLAEIIGYRLCFAVGGVILLFGFLLVLFLVKEDPNTFGDKLKNIKLKDEDEKESKLLTPFIISILIVIFVGRITRTIFIPFVALYVQDTLGTLSGASTLTGIISGATGIATAISAVTITRLGDRFSKFKLAFILTIISLPVALLLIPRYSIFLFIFIYAVYFFIVGSVEPILTSAASEATDYRKKGALFGIMGTVTSAAMMVSPMLGAAISVNAGIHAILNFIPIFIIMQLVLIYINKRKGNGED
ncbi:MFS transporter [Anaerovorax odorimutans]|uniref:MFS transporter n=1 Tax=Anaerovorax odorimutans TaxID=109327 RepID=UPI0004275B06|nr:MFS transporter [Anaerovorax odorimutans]